MDPLTSFPHSTEMLNNSITYVVYVAYCITFRYFTAHGTFIGTIRLDKNHPQQIPIDSELHFGASSRRYVIREKPHTSVTSMMNEKEELEGALLGLPETETELNVSNPRQ